MAAEFLAHENEREEGADFYLKQFSSSYHPGQPIQLLLAVGPIKHDQAVAEIKALIQAQVRCKDLRTDRRGLFFKKPYLFVTLEPLPLTRENMLKVTNTQYDVILRFEVKVEVNVA